MKSLSRRTAGLAMAAVTAAAALTGPAAHADSTYQPSSADFASCPKLPSGATALLWNCVAVIVAGGEFKLGTFDYTLGSPLVIDTAFGFQNGTFTVLPGGSGSGAGGSGGISGLGLVNVTVEQAGAPTGSGLIPDTIPIKVHITGLLVGSNCYIGSDSDPIVLKPTLTDGRVQWFGTTPVLRGTIGDSTFNVPASTGCGLVGAIVNFALGLPSPSGKNLARFDTVVRINNYQLGGVTPSLSMLSAT